MFLDMKFEGNGFVENVVEGEMVAWGNTKEDLDLNDWTNWLIECCGKNAVWFEKICCITLGITIISLIGGFGQIEH